MDIKILENLLQVTIDRGNLRNRKQNLTRNPEKLAKIPGTREES